MNELIALNNTTPATVFDDGGTDEILQKIADEARSVVQDITTPKGRKAIKSLAMNIAKSKTYLDGMGKDLVSGWKSQSKKVDAERKKMRDFLDALKEEIRKPLTEFENAEEKRIAAHQSNIDSMFNSGNLTFDRWIDIPLLDMKKRLSELENTVIDDSWQEFQTKAAAIKDQAICDVKKAIKRRTAYDNEQAELDRLRKESELQAQKNRDDEIRRDADKQAKAAAKAERDKIESERLAEEKAAEKRAANKKHKAKINNEAVADLIKSASATDEQAKLIVTAIAKGKIRHVSISY